MMLFGNESDVPRGGNLDLGRIAVCKLFANNAQPQGGDHEADQ
jgi:hypothetical protein